MTNETYYTIEREASAEFKDRGSRFIGVAKPVLSDGEARQSLILMRKIHPKASHYCFAYRLGPDGNEFRVSDDGEPSGSAGRPILGQIDSRELVNVLVVVVRYFGGTLLGIPGLINTYRSAAALSLQLTPLVRKQVEEEILVRFDYTRIGDLTSLVRQCSCRIVHQEIQLFCQMTLAVPRSRVEEVTYKLQELRNIEISRAAR